MRVNITCLCGEASNTVSLAAQSLPAETHLCHCSSCRYTSGVLAVSYLALSVAPAKHDLLRSYQSSSKLTRYFCPTCGCHVFVSSELNEWSVSSGVVEAIINTSGGERLQETTKLIRHEFVSDTIDGGVSIYLAELQAHRLPFCVQGPDEDPVLVEPDGYLPPSLSATRENNSDQPNDVLHARCHCGSVQYMVSKPNEGSSRLSSPWPDLLVPYHSGSSENVEDSKWWLRSQNTKYLAGTCACRSCRLGSGSIIQTWAFVPKTNIRVDGDPLSFPMQGLMQYESTPGTYREFCKRCGATVFWHCEERPDLIDVSVGLLRADEGARAESWLEWWTERVSFKEDAIDKKLVQALETGLPRLSSS